jgi:allantoin racemase
MRIRIINPTITTTWEQDARHAYETAASPGTEISIRSLEFGTATVESRRDVALVAPGVVAAAREAEADGADAIIVDCMLEPGLQAAREVVTVPVVGPAGAAMHLAATLGHAFSVLAIADNRRPLYAEIARRHGLGPRLCSVRTLGIPVMALDDDADATLAAAVVQATAAHREDGADVIIPGCTGLAGRAGSIAAGLREHGLELTVVDPPSAAVRTAETLVALGLSHSPRTYPRRAAKAVHEPGGAGAPA